MSACKCFLRSGIVKKDKYSSQDNRSDSEASEKLQWPTSIIHKENILECDCSSSLSEQQNNNPAVLSLYNISFTGLSEKDYVPRQSRFDHCPICCCALPVALRDNPFGCFPAKPHNMEENNLQAERASLL
jgi:hypothetical protein